MHERSKPRSARVRVRRNEKVTSKFTGLVVGASASLRLQQSVKVKLQALEATIWQLQSQVTRAFTALAPGSVLGTFPSSVRTNFHGEPELRTARLSPAYTLPDFDSLSLLLVLQCLAESVIFGGWRVVAPGNLSLALDSLKEFHSRAHTRGR